MAAPIRSLGYELVRKSYYSPIPDIEHLPPTVFTRKSELAGLEFDPAAGLRFLTSELAPHLREYRPRMLPDGDPRHFYLDNTLFGPVDTEVLYAVVRRFAPRRVLELGSGFSTLVIADARRSNGQTDPTSHIVCDPFPRGDLVPALREIAAVRAVSAADLDAAEFTQLRPGDLLFVDTTHTVKIGGEVNRLILDILPRIAPGVLIHIHDIYLPWDYPKQFVRGRRFFWAEQYLLQAFLAFNPEFEVLVGTHALTRMYPRELCELVPTLTTASFASSLWIRRRAGHGQPR